jgi:hypothetical protein
LEEKDVDLPECRAVWLELLQPVYFFASCGSGVQRKQKNGSFLADAAPGRYLEPTIAVTRTETASKQHEHRDQDINAHLPTDQLNFFFVF